jgi:hypothetical protein
MSAPTASNVSKMIAAEVVSELKPLIAELKDQIVKNGVTLNAIIAQNLAVASANSSGKTNRQTRTADGKSRTGTRRAATSTPKPPTNAMLFCRYAYGQNYSDIRSTLTKEQLDAAAKDPSVVKKPIEDDEAAHYSAIGMMVWKSFKSDADKEHIRNMYRGYKEEAERAAASPQLDEVEK